MILKKHKAVIAALITAAMTAAAVAPTAASAAGRRTKPEAFGDDTYARRFLSLYDDVITNGGTNGYLSDKNAPSGGFGVPYHCVEELCVEAPDYGHETTSEAMSYIVWMAAMRDNIVKKTGEGGSVGDLAKAWKTMEVMIPKTQTGMMKQETPSATLSYEWEEPEKYYGENIKMIEGNNGKNPVHKYFKQAYSGDEGLYLMHWLADVDDWYGYGGGNGEFTFINTFQRGAQESCFETVPHPSIEELKYGNEKGIKGIFKTNEETVPAQWAYTNAPDAEDRAIQAVYAANRWGVGDDSVTTLAGKMGDQLRNNMFDKYYKKIGSNDPNNMANDYTGAHYLMSWYTSWGGAMDGSWTWQIGASHCHEFYQNPLAAFALLQDKGLNGAMKGQDASKDYKTSLQRQLEYYLWLQSADGPIAGGSTSSWNGRYETPKYNAEDTAKYGTSTPNTFYEMGYQEHPVYADPGSNHWIGNQVWAVQRLAELYYVVKTDGDTTGVAPGGLSIEEALKAVLDRWVGWFVENVELSDDDDYLIPASLDWFGQPATWNGAYNPNANSGLTCQITAMGNSDVGCVSSLCNTLIYYAKANGVKPEAATVENNSDLAGQALYTAKELLDREWELARDEIGLSRTEHNGSMRRIFEQEVFIPEYYKGKMPNGDPLENGATFMSFRSQYLKVDKVQEFKAAYDAAKSSGSDMTEAMESIDLDYHRFWHEGDALLALGTMYELYPEVTPDGNTSQNKDKLEVSPSKVTVEVGKTEVIKPTINGNPVDATFTSTDPSVATVSPDGTVTGVGAGTTTITVSANGKEVKVDVTVKEGATTKPTTAPTNPTTKPTTQPTNPTSGNNTTDGVNWGDVNVDGTVNVADVVALNKFLLNEADNPVSAQGRKNADCQHDGNLDASDSTLIMNYVAMTITYEELCPE